MPTISPEFIQAAIKIVEQLAASNDDPTEAAVTNAVRDLAEAAKPSRVGPIPRNVHLIHKAYITAAGQPDVGIPPTQIVVEGFTVDASAFGPGAEGMRESSEYLEEVRALLTVFGGHVCDEGVQVEFDFEREAYEAMML